MKKNNLIIVTGGTGRFGKILKQKNYKNFIYPTKFDLDILNLNKIERYLKKKKTKNFNTFSWDFSSNENS